MTSSTQEQKETKELSPEELERQKQVQRLLWRQVMTLMTPAIDLLDLILLIQMIVYVFIAPYTKVEESFNVQAIHDLLFHPTNLAVYDHFEFPGVVPRTFLGSAYISTTLMPIVKLLGLFLSEQTVKYLCVRLLRMILGLFCIAAQSFFRNSIVFKFRNKEIAPTADRIDSENSGYIISKWYAVLVICQFHLLFYMSRPLPNVFALGLVFIGLGYWMRDQYSHMFGILGVAAAIFRSDLLVFIAPIALVCLATRKIGLFSGIAVGISALSFGMAISIMVDSYFWQRILWSEGEVLYFNTVLNKSHEWGVQAGHWYFSSALPRSLLAAVAFIPFGVVFHRYQNESVLPYFISALLFVGFYSLLPHKELRFIFFGLPLFNLTAAVGIEQLRRRFKPALIIIFVCLLVSFLLSMVFLYASSYNYYGADALNKLYEIESRNNATKYVHMDTHVTMNGVSRFLQYTNSTWKYSKKEQGVNYRDFSHVLSGKPIQEMTLLEPRFEKVFDLISTQEGFARFDAKHFKIIKEPKIYIYKRRAYIMPQSPLEVELEREKAKSFIGDRENTLNAPLKWCQRPEKLMLTIDLPDVSQEKVYITKDRRFLFKGVSNGKTYVSDLYLYGVVDPQDYTINVGQRSVKIEIMKPKKTSWPRLLQSETEKPAYIRVDWDNWVEAEDTSDEPKIEEDDDFGPMYSRDADGQSTLLQKALSLVVADPETISAITDDIGSFLDTFTQIYCPPFLYAFLITFICTIIFGLFHMTSAVELLVRQHKETLKKLKKQEATIKKNQ